MCKCIKMAISLRIWLTVKKKRLKINAAFSFFNQKFGPFYASPFYAGLNYATLQKLTPLKAGVKMADKIVNTFMWDTWTIQDKRIQIARLEIYLAMTG